MELRLSILKRCTILDCKIHPLFTKFVSCWIIKERKPLLLLQNNFQSWDIYFRQLKDGKPVSDAFTAPPNPLYHPHAAFFPITSFAVESQQQAPQSDLTADQEDIEQHLAVQAIIRSYQVCYPVPSFTILCDRYFLFILTICLHISWRFWCHLILSFQTNACCCHPYWLSILYSLLLCMYIFWLKTGISTTSI